MQTTQESPNSIFRSFVQAISDTDCNALRKITADTVTFDIPGARFVDITRRDEGIDELCEWVETVRRECGHTTFEIHRYFENGCELMANGMIRIERLPRVFKSPCSFHIRFESGKVTAFQLLLDTYALEKFRGEMD